ncbi:ABC transporter ATP-binding protein [Roseospira visakhapatnamensis]|uniref:Glycerol transport system ATP-binding protein n=1 Tax=Roseospira visakhapatnamensis TaxID=390880 RepID=A0A7W6RDQ3_9PROT|nr:ABC transporter ATP-binding protein [Roseospira visakhapatnamensis]MBB4266129.1 glycerol transport system ATP-binding protein [Roseospira visakhapatnamensis]
MLTLDTVTSVVDGETHLADISLTLESGSLNILLGPTLAGKTSLMRLMAGLDAPTSGRVLVDDRDVTGVPVRDRAVAMVYQQFINYPTLSVYENIASPLRVARRPKAEIDRKVREAAALLRLEDMLDRTPQALSGGQQQRTALARALVKDASLVLLDEPLANLDYKLREDLRAELPRLFAASGSILVYATTEPAEALLLGGHTATLHQGRVTQFGPTLDVYRRPATLLTAQTFSDPPLNVLPVTKRGPAVTAADGTAVPLGDRMTGLGDGGYTLGFRPHELSLRPPATTAGVLSAPGVVAVTEITGSESYVHAQALGQRWVALDPGIHAVSPGQTVTLYLDARRCLVFGPDDRLVAEPPTLAAA